MMHSAFIPSTIGPRATPFIAAKAKENLKTSTGGKNPRPCQKSDKAAIDTKKELAFALEPLIAAKAKGNQGKRTDLSQNSVKSVDTQKELAKVAGLSHDTIAKVKIIKARADEPTKEKLRR